MRAHAASWGDEETAESVAHNKEEDEEEEEEQMVKQKKNTVQILWHGKMSFWM